MNQEEKLQRLLRLKRHEHPGEGWEEAFLLEFQRRRASREAAPPRPLAHWKERARAVLESLRRPAVAWSLAAACGVFMLLAGAWPQPDHAGHATAAGAPKQPVPAARTNQGTAEARPLNADTPAIPIDMTVPVGSDGGRLPQPDGKHRTPEQPRDLRDLIGPRLPEPDAR